MDGSAGAVALQLGEIEGLGDDPLARKGGLAVDDHRDHPLPFVVVQVGLLGMDDALDDRVDQLQVAGVEAEGEMDLAPRAGEVVAGIPLVVFDVALVVVAVGAVGTLELGDDLLVGLVQDVRQHVQAAAVGHAHDHLFDAQPGAGVHQFVQQRHHGLGPFEGEALLPEIARVQEVFELLGGDQPRQHPAGGSRGQLGPVEAGFDALLQPVALVLVRDVHVLDADGAAIGGLQLAQEPLQGSVGAPQESTRAHGLFEVFFGEAKFNQIQQRQVLAVVPQRVEPGDEMAHLPVGLHQGLDADEDQQALVGLHGLQLCLF